MAQRKVSHIRDVFVSTETEAVIETLVRWDAIAIAIAFTTLLTRYPCFPREYPSYRFHFLKYRRLEFLDLGLIFPDHYLRTDYVYEMLMSLANLYVAVEVGVGVRSLAAAVVSYIIVDSHTHLH
jgi:hypothetical protein